ncbi:galactose-3-O-sulfotransferase 4 [Ornithorhynchus anatinus]|uniref:Galactose-3-O-sulfotransferase 4 n=1 Tax=Ornithorhynchus anatinus TaxID=9258 RepID=A0A6I8NTF3_ORNAN|nr:galactose-3-O-sulfotransferase 4 [Ornithorhynchus anatinus]XP_039766887.1 galactose-3-O-sulfotransferase 4 [Ornithorhynchus anatinus]
MRPWPGWGLRGLWTAVGVCTTVGFVLQIWGGPFHRRSSSPRGGPPGPWGAPGPQCSPRDHLVFLKTHKTGSSSVLSLLHRYGDRRNLTFALPARYQFGYPRPFQASRVKGYDPQARPPQRYHILCHHMRFNLPEVLRLMPADSFFFSIVRDPASLAASAFSYYRSVSSAFRAAPSLQAFLAAPRRFYRPGGRGDHYARNLLWFDFGLPLPGPEAPAEPRRAARPPGPPRDAGASRPSPGPSPDGPGPRPPAAPSAGARPTGRPGPDPDPVVGGDGPPPSSPSSLPARFVRRALEWVDATFDLVLVAEHFDESLVLLAAALCWELEDVVGFVHNARATGGGRGHGVGERHPLTAVRARAWNDLDWALYLHANRSLWARAERFGLGRLASGVAELRARRAALAGRCLLGGGAVEPGRIADRGLRPFQFGTAGILGYAVRGGLAPRDREACLQLARPELQYKDWLDAKQFGRRTAEGGGGVR